MRDRMRPRRRPSGVTLPELILVVTVVGLVAGIAVPPAARVLDRLAVEQAAREIAAAHARARIAAVLQGRPAVLTVAADLLAVRLDGEPTAVWSAAGPARAGVALAGPAREITFSPVGLATGVGNATYELRRGAAARVVVVSRLGRVRIARRAAGGKRRRRSAATTAGSGRPAGRRAA